MPVVSSSLYPSASLVLSEGIFSFVVFGTGISATLNSCGGHYLSQLSPLPASPSWDMFTFHSGLAASQNLTWAVPFLLGCVLYRKTLSLGFFFLAVGFFRYYPVVFKCHSRTHSIAWHLHPDLNTHPWHSLTLWRLLHSLGSIRTAASRHLVLRF